MDINGSIGLIVCSSQADSVFSGISTFGRLDYHPCLASDAVKYDIAFIGKPDPDTNLVLRTILTVDRCSL